MLVSNEQTGIFYMCKISFPSNTNFVFINTVLFITPHCQIHSVKLMVDCDIVSTFVL